MERLVPPSVCGHPGAARVVNCYEAKLHDVRGKFLPAQAAALGVPKGPLFGRLSKGETVVLPNGAVVSPDLCMEPMVTGATLLLLVCPDESFADALMNHGGIQLAMSRASVVYHAVDAQVACSPRYADWVQRHAGPAAYHVALNQCVSQAPVFRSAAHVQQALATVAPLFCCPLEEPRASVAAPPWLHCARLGESFMLSPARRLGPQPLQQPALSAEVMPAQNASTVAAWDQRGLVVGFLGTGASRPSKVVEWVGGGGCCSSFH